MKMPTASRTVVPMSAALMSCRGITAPSRGNYAGLAFRKDQAYFDRQPDALKIGGGSHHVHGASIPDLFQQNLVPAPRPPPDPPLVGLGAPCAEHPHAAH